MMKILVTGGLGFIGSHLCQHLLAKGNYVFCLDHQLPHQKPHLQHVIKHSHLQFIHHDIIEPIHVEVDQIYHLACPASPIRYRKDPIKTLQTAIWGTKNMLDLATQQHIPILHASTSEIYGHPLQHPQIESDWGNVNCIGINSCYKEGKRAAESFCINYFREHGTRVKIVRIFNTYGPYMDPDDGRVIPSFIISALQNQNLPIFGNGLQTRSFLYIDDLLTGFERMMQHPTFIGPVNLGNPLEISILNLADLILELTESQSTLRYDENLSDDSPRRRPDIYLAKAELSWQPKIPLKIGLTKTIEYFRKLLAS